MHLICNVVGSNTPFPSHLGPGLELEGIGSQLGSRKAVKEGRDKALLQCQGHDEEIKEREERDTQHASQLSNKQLPEPQWSFLSARPHPEMPRCLRQLPRRSQLQQLPHSEWLKAAVPLSKIAPHLSRLLTLLPMTWP